MLAVAGPDARMPVPDLASSWTRASAHDKSCKYVRSHFGRQLRHTTGWYKTAPHKGGWEGEDGSRNWQAPSSGEVGGSRSGAETRLTGIGSGATPETADATSRARACQGRGSKSLAGTWVSADSFVMII